MRTRLTLITATLLLLGIVTRVDAQKMLYSPKTLTSAPMPGYYWQVNVLNVSDQAVGVLIYLCDIDIFGGILCANVGNQSLAPGESVFEAAANGGFSTDYRYAKVIHFGPAGAIKASLQSVFGPQYALPLH